MRVLLDECVPKRLARLLPGHEVRTVPQMGWAGVRNGRLLSLAGAAPFDVLIARGPKLRIVPADALDPSEPNDLPACVGTLARRVRVLPQGRGRSPSPRPARGQSLNPLASPEYRERGKVRQQYPPRVGA